MPGTDEQQDDLLALLAEIAGPDTPDDGAAFSKFAQRRRERTEPVPMQRVLERLEAGLNEARNIPVVCRKTQELFEESVEEGITDTGKLPSAVQLHLSDCIRCSTYWESVRPEASPTLRAVAATAAPIRRVMFGGIRAKLATLVEIGDLLDDLMRTKQAEKQGDAALAPLAGSSLRGAVRGNAVSRASMGLVTESERSAGRASAQIQSVTGQDGDQLLLIDLPGTTQDQRVIHLELYPPGVDQAEQTRYRPGQWWVEVNLTEDEQLLGHFDRTGTWHADRQITSEEAEGIRVTYQTVPLVLQHRDEQLNVELLVFDVPAAGTGKRRYQIELYPLGAEHNHRTRYKEGQWRAWVELDGRELPGHFTRLGRWEVDEPVTPEESERLRVTFELLGA